MRERLIHPDEGPAAAAARTWTARVVAGGRTMGADRAVASAATEIVDRLLKRMMLAGRMDRQCRAAQQQLLATAPFDREHRWRRHGERPLPFNVIEIIARHAVAGHASTAQNGLVAVRAVLDELLHQHEMVGVEDPQAPIDGERYPLLARLPLRKNPRVTEWICEFTDWLPELRRIERLLTAAERAQPYRGRQLRNEARGIAGALVTRATGKGPTTPRWPESDGFMLGVETRTIAGVQMRTAPTLLRFKDAGDVGSTDLAAVVEGCVVLLWQTLCNVQARHGSPVVHLAGRARTAIDGVELLVAVLDEFRRATACAR